MTITMHIGMPVRMACLWFRQLSQNEQIEMVFWKPAMYSGSAPSKAKNNISRNVASPFRGILPIGKKLDSVGG